MWQITHSESCAQIHKIMAGLLDHYLFMAHPLALQMVIDEADFFYRWVDSIIATQGKPHWIKMLNNEFGGMSEVLYNLYGVTNSTKHLRCVSVVVSE